MKVKVHEEFNVFELFVHDNEALHAVCPAELAEAINEHLLSEGWRVYPPDGLGLRFTLYNDNDGGEKYTERYYSVDQVKSALPAEAIEALEAINDLELDISLRAER